MNLPSPFGRYELLEKIATGGMAEIFKAKLVGVEGFEKILVLKRILPVWSERKDFITMLVDEAKVLVHLNHPNIVQVYELGRVGSVYFIAMEYVDGFDLKKLMNRIHRMGRKLPQEVALTLIIDALQGLFYAHERTLPEKGSLGIVHRDISPQNILLSLEGEVKVTDFGIAKAITQTHETQTGVLKGKYAYMSPEQALGQALDYRSDIFSTGIVLWEILFNRRLFLGRTDLETLENVRWCQVPWPEERTAELKPGIVEALNRALAPRREDRFQSAEEFADALEACLPKGRRLANRKLAKFFQEIMGEEILARRDRERQNQLVLQERQTQVDSQPEGDTQSLVKGPSLDPTNPAPQDRSLGFSPPTRRTSKLVPILLGFLWLALAIGLTLIVIRQFRGAGEMEPPAGSPESSAPLQGQPVPPPVPSPALGSLHLSVNPSQAHLTAEFDGKKQAGVGELRLESLPEGTEVSVRASLNGYEPVSEKIKISSPERNVIKTIQMKKQVSQVGSIRVGASPWGKVFMGGMISGTQTPMGRSKIPAGNYPITVKNDSLGMVANGTVKIRPNRVSTCTVLWKSHRVSCQ